jgi:hypothetical protein
MGSYTAIIKRDGDWWIGWVEEVPGINAQERSREELLTRWLNPLKNKRSAIPRHSENRDLLVRNICKDLDIPSP